MGKTVFALVAHPDDIEFMMAGTLIRLRDFGFELHYMTIANGSCGSIEYNTEEIVKIRRQESMEAAKFLGAVYHESLCNDFEIFYQDALIRKVTAIIREVKPDIIFLPSLQDYMEDHMNSARIGSTAAFAKGSPNYSSIPPRDAIQMDVALYHAMPAGLHTMMGISVIPELFIDISDVIDQKSTMLSMHKSQQKWLSASQGMNEYIASMEMDTLTIGTMSGSFKYAEGWRLHNHLGYSQRVYNPLKDLFC